MRRTLRFLSTLSILSALTLGACAPSQPRGFEPTPPTADGLRQVAGTGHQKVFIRPGVDLNDVDRILVDPFMVSYTNPQDAPEAPVNTLDAETERRLASVLQDAFIQAMRYSREFELVEQPGPRTARVQGWLYDLVVEKPDRVEARHFSLCFAEMTVMLGVRDSQTAQPIARVEERIALSCGETGRAARFDTRRWRDVQAAVTPWARFLRIWLEELKRQPVAAQSSTMLATKADDGMP